MCHVETLRKSRPVEAAAHAPRCRACSRAGVGGHFGRHHVRCGVRTTRLSDQVDPSRGRLRRGRTVRHRSARGRPKDERNPRPADRDREPDRGRRNHRNRLRGGVGRGRLHADAADDRQCDQRDPVQEHAVQGWPAFHGGRAARRNQQRAGRASVAAGDEHGRVYRARKGQAGRDVLCDRGHRLVDTSEPCVVRHDGRHHDEGRALSRRRSRHDRPAVRPGQDHVLEHRARHRRRSGRKVAGAGDDRGKARPGLSGAADRRRGRASGLRDAVVARALRQDRDTASGHRQIGGGRGSGGRHRRRSRTD